MTSYRFAVAVLLLAVCAQASLPQFQALWNLWGHGVNARTPFSPTTSNSWASDLKNGMSCQFASWSIPFDSLTSYGPFAIHPLDGRIFVGLICNNAPYLWIVANNGTASQFVSLNQGSQCSSQFPDADTAFEGYFNFLPDGSLVFGMCGKLFIYDTEGVLTSQSVSLAPVVIGVANTNPPQLLWAGGYRKEWWTQWGMYALNFTSTTSINVSMAQSVADSTLMWGVDGATLYNGHFDQWAPQGPYGLQTYPTPLSASTTPSQVIPNCGETRPWTFANDKAGNVYTSSCDDLVLAKYDMNGNQVWNISTLPNFQSSVTLFMTDDEEYVYIGDTRYMIYVISASNGKVYKSFNLTSITEEQCDTVYGPFAARWPVPLNGKHSIVTICTTSSSGTTTLAVIDPANLKKPTVFSKKSFTVTSIFVDAMNNVYAIGTKQVGAAAATIHVERWTYSSL